MMQGNAQSRALHLRGRGEGAVEQLLGDLMHFRDLAWWEMSFFSTPPPNPTSKPNRCITVQGFISGLRQ